VTLDVSLVGVFLLVLARTSAWVMAAPVFSTKGIASLGRLALAIALSLFLAPLAVGHATVPDTEIGFALVAGGQILVGLALGWATGLLMHAFEVAGSAIDTASGFSVGALLDPMSGVQSSTFSRFTNLLFVTLFFASNAHHVVLEGFTRSFQAVPADKFPAINGDALLGLGHAVTGLILAAIEIGAPVLGALFLTEVALAVAARFAPQANVFMIGLPLKVLVTLLAMGTALVWLPTRLSGLVDTAVRTGAGLLR
jgi:flagellar biosynthetic protein FliR